MSTIPHGTQSGYGYHRCRCDSCRAAWAAKQREYQRRRHERFRQGEITNVVHGTESTYVNYGCRCDLCRAAFRVGCALRRQGKGPQQ